MLDQTLDQTPTTGDTPSDQVDQEVDQVKTEVFQKLYDLPLDEREDVLMEQTKRMQASMAYMTLIYPSLIAAFKKYRSIAEPIKDELGKSVPGRANIFIPYPWAIVETEMPRLAGRLPRVHAFPRQRLEQRKVEAIQDLIYYSMDRMGFLRLQQLWLRQFEIYGFSPLVYYWRNEQKEVFSREKDQMSGAYALKRKLTTVWDDFSARVVDVFDTFMQPGCEQPEDGDWWMFREFVSKRDLKDRVEAGTLYPEVLNYLKENASGSVTNRQNDTGRNDRDALIANEKTNTGYSQQSYGRYELMWTLENKKVIGVLDGKILAACGDNPEPMQRKAMINLNLMPQVNEPIGISTIEALGGLPDKLNALSNARLDNISLLVNRVILANRNSQTDFDNLIMTAGNVILTDNIEESVKVMDIPDIGMSSEREIATTKEELQFTVGISDFIVGTKGGGRLADTATGVSTIVREGNARFALKLATYEAYPLRRLVEAIHTYNMMYMPDEKRIHVLGPKGYTTKDVTLEDILCQCDFIIEPGSSMPLDQPARRDAYLQLLDRAIKLPQMVDIPKLLKEVFSSFEIPSPEDLLLQKDTLPEADDINLAQAENIALAQRQDIELIGNDQLHVMVHQRGLQTQTDPEIVQRFQEHIQAHEMKLQTIAAPALAAGKSTLFGGPSNGQQQQQPPQGGPAQPAQGAPGAAPSGAGQPPAMGGVFGVSR